MEKKLESKLVDKKWIKILNILNNNCLQFS